MANPFNKDLKYKALLEYWQNQLDGQNDMLKEAEDVIKERETTRTALEEEEKTLVDNLCARAIQIKALLKQVHQQKKVVENGIQLIQAARGTILVEMSRLSNKQIKSAEKAEKKWEEAKKEGRLVNRYVPTERALKPRHVIPVVVTLANYFARE